MSFPVLFKQKMYFFSSTFLLLLILLELTHAVQLFIPLFIVWLLFAFIFSLHPQSCLWFLVCPKHMQGICSHELQQATPPSIKISTSLWESKLAADTSPQLSPSLEEGEWWVMIIIHVLKITHAAFEWFYTVCIIVTEFC